jgi:hypothetical protein
MDHRSRILVQTLALVALLHPPLVLHAQSGQMLTSGTRVRIAAPAVADTLLVGLVAFHVGDTLTLAPATRRAQLMEVPLLSIERLEVSRGQRLNGSNAALGAILGGGAGALGGYAAASLSSCSGIACGAGEAVGAIAGGVVGSLLGALLGAEIGLGPERWEERRLHTQPAVAGRVPREVRH